MLMCMSLVADTLLYCRPPLAFYSAAAKRDRGKLRSLIHAPIHLHNRRVGITIGNSFMVPQLMRQSNHERLGRAQCSKFIYFFPILAVPVAILNLDGCCFFKEVLFQCITFKTNDATLCYILNLHIMSINCVRLEISFL